MRIHNIMLVTALLSASAGMARATCNLGYVHQDRRIITVLPTNSDDTENLQCAFDLGSQLPGSIVQLEKGTYITGRIKVDGFIGEMRGKGMNVTTIRNSDTPIYVTPDDWYMIPAESDAYAPPLLFVFLGGDYAVTDLTVSIVGSEPATDWSIFGLRDVLGQGIRSLGASFAILGSPTGRGYRQANAAFHRVRLTGEVSNDPLYGYNNYNGAIFEGWGGPDLEPLKGRFSVHDSVLDNVASATPVDNLKESLVSISGNTMRNVALGAEVVDLNNTIYVFSHNRITGTAGVMMYDSCFGASSNCGMNGSELMIRNNVIQTADGILIDAGFSGGTTALVLGNNLTGVSGTAVRLGPETSKCLVFLTSPATVEDLGTDNVVIGPKEPNHKHGGPIRSLPHMGKHR